MMDQKLKEAAALHAQGFNCAQAVGMPFAEELGMPKELAAKALEGFGAGMGSREQACGALSGAIFVAGLKNADGNSPATKKQTYDLAKALGEAFESQCGDVAWEDWFRSGHEFGLQDRAFFDRGLGKYLTFVNMVLKKAEN